MVTDGGLERRLIARELLDRGDALAAYAVARDHAAESAEKRIDAEFHAGWIALRFLNHPATAARHFADAAKIAAKPISVARTAYWQGRAAEALGAHEEARGFYEKAAGYSITYYGQLARAKLGLPEVQLRTVEAGGSLGLRTARGGEGRQTVVRGRAPRHRFSALRRSRGEPDRCRSARRPGPTSGRERRCAHPFDDRQDGGAARLPARSHAFPTLGVPGVRAGQRPG